MDARYEEIEARLAEKDEEIRFLETRCAELVEEKLALLERIKAYQAYFQGAM